MPRMNRILFPLILGLGGMAILLWLGFWQIERLAWKEDILAERATLLAADPVPLPAQPDPETMSALAVAFSGSLTGEELHVLTSGTAAGTGYRVIAAFETDTARRVMVDLGLLPLDAKDAPAATFLTEVTGNLIWPDDRNSSTPDPDIAGNIWFAREVGPMAQALGAEPIMVVARSMSPVDPRVTPLPMDNSTIKNDHLEYAITWFALAAVWAAMTLWWMFKGRAED